MVTEHGPSAPDLDALACGTRRCPPEPGPGRVEATTPPAPIRGVELTQATQHFPLDGLGLPRWPNSIALVAEKELYVRLYPDTSAGAWPGGALPTAVGLEVTVDRGSDGVDVFTGPPTTLAGLSPHGRADAAGSINAVVAAVACRGRARLSIRLLDRSPSGAVVEIARHEMVLSFLRVPRIPVYVVPVGLLVDGVPGQAGAVPVAAPSDAECDLLLDEVARRFPVPALELVARAPAVTYAVAFATGPWEVAKRLNDHALATTADLVMVGVMGATWVDLVPDVWAQRYGAAVAAPAGKPGSATHELGHMLGRIHSPCQGNPDDPDYPVIPNGPAGAIEEYGFRVSAAGAGPATLSALDPTAPVFDYMGTAACAPDWTSAYGYRWAMRGARRCVWRQRAPRAERMLIDLRVADDGVAELGPSYIVETAPPTPRGTPSAVAVDLLAGDGTVLRRHRLHHLDPPTDPSAAELPTRFIEAVPWHPGTRAIRVRHAGLPVATIPIGIAMVGLVEPRVERHSEDGRQVRLIWGPGPADDETRFLVRFTNDGGGDWYVLAVDVPDTSLDLDLGGLPGGPECAFEVAATKEGRTTVRRTDPFAIEPLPRRVAIVTPRGDGDEPAVLGDAELVELIGSAFSPDLARPPLERLQWTVVDDEAEGERRLGQGERLVIPASELPGRSGQIRLTLGDDVDAVRIVRKSRGDLV